MTKSACDRERVASPRPVQMPMCQSPHLVLLLHQHQWRCSRRNQATRLAAFEAPAETSLLWDTMPLSAQPQITSKNQSKTRGEGLETSLCGPSMTSAQKSRSLNSESHARQSKASYMAGSPVCRYALTITHPEFELPS
jgi:hypothetical protein